MVITRKGFSQVVGNGFAGLGFAPEAPTIYEFPVEMFLAGSDLTPLKENFDKLIYGLTKWQSKTKVKGVYNPGEKITVQGMDYQDALDKMNQLFLKNSWSDGLPLTPATRERVDWILTGTDLSRDAVVGTGKILPRGGIATVEGLAIALAMAGGRPEYLPVLIATVDAMTVPEAMLADWNSTTSSNYPAIIVNGSIARQIRLNSGYGIMGPDPLHPADGPIGRALRLILMNLGGAVPGVGTMGIYGMGRYTNAVFAEDEEGLPPGWPPLSVQRGFTKGTNIVTVLPVSGATNVQFTNTDATTAEGAVLQFLSRMAGVIGGPGGQNRGFLQQPNHVSGIVLLPRTNANELEKTGWSKEKVEAFLKENSKIPWNVVVKTGRLRAFKDFAKLPEGQALPLAPVILAVAGGLQSGHGYWMQVGKMSRVVSKEIKLPQKAKWDELLKKAEQDLGPIPAME